MLRKAEEEQCGRSTGSTGEKGGKEAVSPGYLVNKTDQILMKFIFQSRDGRVLRSD